MVGDGPDRERYRETIAKLGLSRRIRMYDAMPATQAFALARTVVVPSRAEAMPYIVLEALAAQKTDRRQPRRRDSEVLGSDSEALAIPGDARDLSRIMAETLADPDWQVRVMPKAVEFRVRLLGLPHGASDDGSLPTPQPNMTASSP